MKIKSFSFLLALVMILSAFAGTFTVSAEGEAVATPWSVNGTRYETFDAAIDAAVSGDTVYLHEDTVNTIETNEVYYINKDVTIEGVAKADGSYPTLGIKIRWRRYAVAANGDDDYVDVLFKNMTINFIYMYNYMYDVCKDSSLTFENVDFILTQGHTSNVYGAPFRVSGTNSELTFRECTMLAKEAFYPCQDFKALIAINLHEADQHEPVANTITIDTCQIDLKACMKTCGLIWTEHLNNDFAIRNSTIDTTDDAIVINPAEFAVNYRGTNTINGLTTTHADVDYLIFDKQAKDLGWEGGSLEPVAPGMCIGGDWFGNYEGLLPEDRNYTECDIDTLGASKRGAKRIVFSNDGLIYYTEDHYESFELLYGEE